jgi:hypothetical protein
MSRPVAIDFDLAGPIDIGRLRRATRLTAEPAGDGRWCVRDVSGMHWVDLYHPEFPRCDCEDHLWRDEICKHMLAALIREGHPLVLLALRAMVVNR